MNYAHIHQHFLYLPVPRAIKSSKISPRKDVYIMRPRVKPIELAACNTLAGQNAQLGCSQNNQPLGVHSTTTAQ